MNKLIRALNAGWMTLYVMGDTRVMYHRIYGTKNIEDIDV